MDIACCVCGENLPGKLGDAIQEAIEGRSEGRPTIGLVCDACLKELKG